jgi:hypothetical protein
VTKAIEIFEECGADGWMDKYEKELASFSLKAPLRKPISCGHTASLQTECHSKKTNYLRSLFCAYIPYISSKFPAC